MAGLLQASVVGTSVSFTVSRIFGGIPGIFLSLFIFVMVKFAFFQRKVCLFKLFILYHCIYKIDIIVTFYYDDYG